MRGARLSGLVKGWICRGGLRTSGRFTALAVLTLDIARRLAEEVMLADRPSAIDDILNEACRRMGCRYFALSHHLDFLAVPGQGIRRHNYPEDWVRWFDERRLGLSDPVHRASQRTAAGFAWHDIARLVTIGPADRVVLELARRHGIGDGLTIPAHIPGEAHGSCSFAALQGRSVSREHLPFAQIIGSFAFEAARRLAASAQKRSRARLTDRQRECVLWIARGKTDWEIARILGVSHVTVIEHVRHARERYGAPTRVTLAVRALFDGLFSFGDIAGR